ncbi:hypothetical protein VTL71DRAFT_8966 [Oculimacula yallundae]|uniref:Flavin-containing monooxygenase n=1 Tax=Oculimacula yallundae TaxID=86028 RepID=A0ABR4BTD5_9HELO
MGQNLSLNAPPKKKRVAVIGAGVSGLCAAKYLLAERTNEFPNEECFEVTIFERKDQAGGIWNQTEADDKFATPMYPACNTNVPRTMMQYTGVPYPDNTPLFPRNTVVKDYLQAYAKELEDRNIIKYNCDITAVEICYDKSGIEGLFEDSAMKKWQVTLNNAKTIFEESSLWDAVVVAVGTFTKPNVPPLFKHDIKSPITILYSKMYRDVEQFRGKVSDLSSLIYGPTDILQRVLIVGGGPSYWDMSREIVKVSSGRVLVSIRSANPFVLSSAKQTRVSQVASFQGNTVSFETGEYHVAPRNVDIILLCTGYLYEFPMLKCIRTTEDRKRVLNLYNQMIYIEEDEDPTSQQIAKKRTRGAETLAFVGLPTMDAPFLVAEAQCAFISRYLSGRCYISVSDMKAARDEEFVEFNRSRPKDQAVSMGFHSFDFPRDALYVNQLFDVCLRAELLGSGKNPPFHNAYLRWVRLNNGRLRNTFYANAKDNEDGTFPTPETLGFECEVTSNELDYDVRRTLISKLMSTKHELSRRSGEKREAGLKLWQSSWSRAMEKWTIWKRQRSEEIILGPAFPISVFQRPNRNVESASFDRLREIPESMQISSAVAEEGRVFEYSSEEGTVKVLRSSAEHLEQLRMILIAYSGQGGI